MNQYKIPLAAGSHEPKGNERFQHVAADMFRRRARIHRNSIILGAPSSIVVGQACPERKPSQIMEWKRYPSVAEDYSVSGPPRTDACAYPKNSHGSCTKMVK